MVVFFFKSLCSYARVILQNYRSGFQEQLLWTVSLSLSLTEQEDYTLLWCSTAGLSPSKHNDVKKEKVITPFNEVIHIITEEQCISQRLSKDAESFTL